MRIPGFSLWHSRSKAKPNSRLNAVVACGIVFLSMAVASSQANVRTVPLGRKPAPLAYSKANQFHTFISTDKPLYRSGENVYIRGVLLDASSHEPVPGLRTQVYLQVKGPRGQNISTGYTSIQDSVWSYGWKVADDQAGGEYTIQATYPGQGFPSAERKIDVRSYRAPRLKTQIIFARDGYGPGDKVAATLYAKRAEGGIPAGAKVTIKPLVDGAEINGGTSTVDSKGLCRVTFSLPQKIEKGDGTLALVIEDGAVVETASKTIPIVLQSVDLQMFPEGGELVAGFKNRVYVQALLPNGKPADLMANVVSAGPKQKAQALFRTEHEGRGRFEFTPEANKQYYLKILKPSGIKKTYALPKVKTSGAIIHSENDIIKNGQPIKLQIGAASSCRVTVSKRDKELSSRIVSFTKNSHKNRLLVPVALSIPSDVDGVLTVTVWDEFDKPLAERLVFHEPVKPLNISVHADKKSYVPGDNAKISIRTTDSTGRPVAAVVGVTVTDDSVLQMIEKRDQAPRLPVMVFLEPEVKDLADAQFYLNAANPRAGLATDLLLGTQGWRRFAHLDEFEFVRKYGDKAKRVLAITEQPNVIGRGLFGTPVPSAVSQIARPRSRAGQITGVQTGGSVGLGSNVWRKSNDGQSHGARFQYAPNVWKNEEANTNTFKLPEEMGRVEGPRDVNMFQVEPTIIDERHYSTGRAERHQKTSPTLPEGAPIPDGDSNEFIRYRRSNRNPILGAESNNLMFAVREFVHQVRPNRNATDRVDFAETLFWNQGIKTNQNGEATINFGLSDNVTSFQVAADGFSNSGSIGAKAIGIKSVQPFYAEAKLPLEVTAGDQILLPVNLINGTGNLLSSIGLNIEIPSTFKLLPVLQLPQQLRAGERARCIQPINVGFERNAAVVTINAKAGNSIDKVVRKLKVKPAGFPVEITNGGLLEPGKSTKFILKVEDGLVPSSLTSKCEIYPAPLANLTSALERLIQDPYGCFEQTSSTSYPLTMAQQYFQSHSGVDPSLISTSSAKLEDGYKKLISFWCPDRGYEWFGQNPGHEALTAYGLMHFADMAKVRTVDQNMFATTRAWLMRQKDGKGGFSRKARSSHSWIEDQDSSNAYIVWALMETGEPAANLKLELASLKTVAGRSQNSYVIALAANAFDIAGDKVESQKLMRRLATLQRSNGSVDKITNSIVGSSGESLELEGTALSTLAWLRHNEFAANVEKSMTFLADSCKAGRYGSTQSTVLTLRTILAYDKKHAHPKAPGKVLILADGKSVGEVAFDQKSEEAIKLPDLSKQLTPGEHEIELRMVGGSIMPYSIAASYNRFTPESSKSCKLDLSVRLNSEKVREGSPLEAVAVVTNKTDEVLPTPIAIIGLPGGLEPRHDQLKELVKRGKIDAYEVRGREVVLYWRGLRKSEKIEVPISLIASVPGKYTGPASSAYLYYTNEHKKWVSGLKVEIAAK
ncbi:MAG: A-macroglobulin complement component [Cyanobacteria bacterium DS2.3.42]|nr:A-macroglobulin complement component [Cyanobacteria bacterium DS2.3.42]